jgi:hypothetical protein
MFYVIKTSQIIHNVTLRLWVTDKILVNNIVGLVHNSNREETQ